MKTRLRILEKSNELFRKFGVRSVTMDDIARELGMSKKTLYRHFSNKASIVKAITQNHFEQEIQSYSTIHGQAENALEEMILVMKWISESFKNITPAMIYDVQKYYPESWQLFHEFKTDFVQKSIYENLQQGVEAGLYRKDMDINIIAKLRLDEVEFFLDPSAFGEGYDLPRIHYQLMEHYVHGLVSMKGKKLLNKYLNKEENE